MQQKILAALPEFLQVLGLKEEPMGIFFSDQEPAEGLSPEPMETPTRERELAGQIDWGAVFGGFSCSIGHIWRARRKNKPAYFSAQRFGCPGAAFWMGFLKPQTEAIVHYVSCGIPNQMEGEFYLATADECRSIFEYADPEPAPAKYIVFKPLGQMTADEEPELVAFFCRPESLAGLHQLATFVTADPEVVRSPFSAACGSLVAWPLHYRARGQEVAVLGGWDPSARKFFKTDELSFTVPFGMFQQMLERWSGSFLNNKDWKLTRQKIARSQKAWGEAD